MKHLIILFLLLTFSLFTGSFSFTNVPANTDDIVGEWYLSDKSGIVSIYERNGFYYSKSFKMSEPNGPDGKPKRDMKNPDKNKRNRLIEEVEFLYDFKFDGRNKWYGEIYNTDDGRTYSGQISLNGANTLVLRGYIGTPLLGRSVTWSRYH